MKPRTYPVPQWVRTAHLAPTTTLDELELIRDFNGEVGDWARRILAAARGPFLVQTMGKDRQLPRGLLPSEDSDVVIGLVNHKDETWTPKGWRNTGPVVGSLIDLPPDDIAFVVRAFDEGASAVLLHPATPVAWLDRHPRRDLDRLNALTAAKEAKTKGYPKLPDTAKIVAVVDELDRNAVLELIAILPGSRVVRRHDGLWYPDRGWAQTMKSVKPPPVVVLKPEIRQSVISQVDEATKAQPFEETGLPPKPKQPRAAAALLATCASLEERAEEAFCQFVLAAAEQAMTADVGSPVSGMPAKLQKYWAFGEGALKIRWGTPGAWTRCHRNLTKYVGPFRAKGTCTNLAKLRGGHGVATHVGD